MGDTSWLVLVDHVNLKVVKRLKNVGNRIEKPPRNIIKRTGARFLLKHGGGMIR